MGPGSPSAPDGSRGRLPPEMRVIRRRILFCFQAFLLSVCLLLGRFCQLQAFPHHQLPPLQHKVVPARRGQILAADGTAMAVTQYIYNVCANPLRVTRKAEVAAGLQQAIGGQAADYLAALSRTHQADGSPNGYVCLAKQVPEEKADCLRRLIGPQGRHETKVQKAARRALWEHIWLDPNPRRFYPLGRSAAQLLGFTTPAGHGAEGLEKAQDKMLAGRDGAIRARMDSRGRPIPGYVAQLVQPQDGQSIVTTIEPAIQTACDDVLTRLLAKYHPNFAIAMVMRPQTGEVLAVATAPTYDPNHRPANVVQLAADRPLTYAFEPGSTFKIITAAAAVERVPNWRHYTFDCEGVAQVGGRPLHCWVSSTSKKRHGVESLSDSIRDSCNFGVFGFARLVGAPQMARYARAFGIGRAINLAELREQKGGLNPVPPSRWGQRDLASFSFGQGAMLTLAQLVRAAGVVANEGIMMQPMLIKELRDREGHVLQRFVPHQIGRVIQPGTAHIVRGMLERVVREGTASKFIFVPGYQAAGKTGSAQKADHGSYAAGRFIASFVGFLPSSHPEYVIAVMADEPHASHWGSEVCGPAFTDIAQTAMLQLRLAHGAAAPAPQAALMTRPVRH